MEFPYIVVDESEMNVNTIQLALETHDRFMCVGIANTEQTGLDLILERMPALVFLNIDMPGSSGDKTLFFLINELRKYVDRLPEFVVLAKSANYAIEGIRNGVLDYILNPIDKNFLRRTLLRFQKQSNTTPESTICFKSYGDYKFVNVNEVMYLKADNNTTDFIMENGATVGAYKSLKYFQESLPNHFIRIHNSYIVNIKFISRIHLGKAKCCVKDLKSLIPFSKSYRENVEFMLEKLSSESVLVG
jgi:DNA-binding LytR/AlgR family response regulator